MYDYQKYRRSRKRFKPPNKQGNLYYVRFATRLGYFYKLGFTTADSVEKRFSYKSKDFLNIDKVLLFEYLDNAYDIEKKLHSYLSDRALFKDYKKHHPVYPLFKNGQSELYLEDLLNLDPEYTEERRFSTFVNVKLALEENKTIGIFKLAVARTADRILNLCILPFNVYLKKHKGLTTSQAIYECLDRIIAHGQVEKIREDNDLIKQAHTILADAGINLEHQQQSRDEQ
ncbi:hypothetical protein [Wohlfahrtiimonas chitiniclastica]|uniref:hypothetical protein n=1 Tax=Wohlfahrtiimonas chitiniclastica TaxID=400946 RepID=UPI001BCBD537|nr:hypothetical protein [Wohlfahrtiimonas chitiniclastica]MBS7815865.1 hypothetical protein [Wohlfahrtiimonas chitiniclastica]MBS7822140.1 hypothetical protein [Wohlfahrtiimonas chitiniclastica]MBS7829932.1 hypothetical protein [Wohlfahrtiimonas chitiniclastica]MBS7831899.1 hypothetical protein [Wohlfahrtiimonas chitiniclastica]